MKMAALCSRHAHCQNPVSKTVTCLSEEEYSSNKISSATHSALGSQHYHPSHKIVTSTISAALQLQTNSNSNSNDANANNFHPSKAS
mmetsp:Transcript_15762/g.34524  ORF Transcript_15762/g.34524 Transcript_15762/m.34524 type:complete len:87 (-) Transcript_15762:905-1165(-)